MKRGLFWDVAFGEDEPFKGFQERRLVNHHLLNLLYSVQLDCTKQNICRVELPKIMNWDVARAYCTTVTYSNLMLGSPYL
jgi:hypothetical protein